MKIVRNCILISGLVQGCFFLEPKDPNEATYYELDVNLATENQDANCKMFFPGDDPGIKVG